MNKIKAQVLFQCLCFALVISLSPLKIVGYFFPILLLVMLFFRLPSRSFYKKLLIAVLSFGAIGLFYFLKATFFNHNFSWVGALLSLMTYGSLVSVLVYPSFKIGYDDVITKKVNHFLFIVFVVETMMACLQLFLFLLLHVTSFDGAVGDIVQGTINPLSFINESVGFNNQVFTINYVFLLAYLVPFLRKTKQQYLIFVAVFVILMASVLHVVFSFLLALLTCSLLIGFIRYRKQIIKFLFLGGSLAALLFVMQPKNFSLFSFYYNDLVSLESPKSLVLVNTLAFLPKEYPDALLLGLGPGQYTSRASLMTTGRYFGEFNNPTKIPLLDGSFTSKAFKDYVFDIWETYATNAEQYGNSTMSRPFFSILSLCTEFGVIVFVVLTILLFRQLLKMRRRYLQQSAQKQRVPAYFSFVNMVSVLFLFCLAFFENYLESSASICAGLLLMKYFSALQTESLRPAEN